MLARLATNSTALAERRPWAMLGPALGLCLLALAAAACWLRIEADPASLVDEDLPFMQAYETWKQAMPQLRRGTILVIDAPTPEAAAAIQTRLGEAMAARPDLFRSLYLPGSGDIFARAAALYLPVDRLQAMTDRLAQIQPALAAVAGRPDLAGLAEARALLGNDCEAAGVIDAMLADAAAATASGAPATWSWQRLVLGPAAPPARRLILYQGTLDDTDAAVTQAARAAVLSIVADAGLDATPGVSIRMTGRGALSDEEVERGLADLTVAGIASMVAIVVVLLAGLRTWRTVLATVLVLAIGLLWTAGFAAAAFGTLTLLSAAFAVLFVGLGADVVIHLLLGRRELGPLPAARAIARPLALCTLTTAIGFLAFVPTSYSGLAQLGIIAASGMALALLAAFTVLPALLALLEGRARPIPGVFRPIGRHAGRRGLAWAVVAVTGLLAAASLPLALSLGFDFNSVNLQDPDAPSVTALRDLTEDGLATPRALSLLAEDAGDATAIERELEVLDSVAAVTWRDGYIPDDQEAKLAILGDAAFYLWGLFDRPAPPPLDADERAQALEALRYAAVCGNAAGTLAYLEQDAALQQAFEKQVMADLPALLADLELMLETGPVTPADLPPALLDRLEAGDGRLALTVLPAGSPSDTEAVARFVDDVTDRYPAATGQPALEAGIGAIVVTAFGEAIALAFAAVVVVLALLLRRARDVALALVPLLLAALFTAATARLLGQPLNYANVIVLPLLFGLGVDNGIHMVSRWRTAGGLDGLLASSTPRAVVLSALTTLASFASLAFVGQQAIASLGVMLTVAMIWLLVTTTVVLPALMAVTDRGGGGGKSVKNP